MLSLSLYLYVVCVIYTHIYMRYISMYNCLVLFSQQTPCKYIKWIFNIHCSFIWNRLKLQIGDVMDSLNFHHCRLADIVGIIYIYCSLKVVCWFFVFCIQSFNFGNLAFNTSNLSFYYLCIFAKTGMFQPDWLHLH